MKCEDKGCNKKLIMEFNCRMCKKAFCIYHRLPEKHSCENYDGLKKEKVSLIKIIADKLQRI